MTLSASPANTRMGDRTHTHHRPVFNATLEDCLFHLGVGAQIGLETEGVNRWDEGFHSVKRRPRLRCILHDEQLMISDGRRDQDKQRNKNGGHIFCRVRWKYLARLVRCCAGLPDSVEYDWCRILLSE